MFVFIRTRRPPIATLPDTLLPYTTLVRSVGVRNLRQAGRAAAHQQVHEDQPRRPDAHQLARPEAALAADEEQPDADQDGQRRAPLFGVWIEAEDDQPPLLLDQRPAGAGQPLAAADLRRLVAPMGVDEGPAYDRRSEEHTSELQSLMRN